MSFSSAAHWAALQEGANRRQPNQSHSHQQCILLLHLVLHFLTWKTPSFCFCPLFPFATFSFHLWQPLWTFLYKQRDSASLFLMLLSLATLHYSLMQRNSLDPSPSPLPFCLSPPSKAVLVPRFTLNPALGGGQPHGQEGSDLKNMNPTKRWGLSHQSSALAMARNPYSREGRCAYLSLGHKGLPFSCPHCRRTSLLTGYDAGHEVFFLMSLWYKRQRILLGENPLHKRFYLSACIVKCQPKMEAQQRGLYKDKESSITQLLCSSSNLGHGGV